MNSSISAPSREQKGATFEAFVAIWERDYLSFQAFYASNNAWTGQTAQGVLWLKELRQIEAADGQRLVAKMEAEEYEPKTTRNLWGTLRPILDAALAQGYVDRLLPKPKLPRAPKKKLRYFRLTDVATFPLLKPTGGVFYWLAADTGLRAGS